MVENEGKIRYLEFDLKTQCCTQCLYQGCDGECWKDNELMESGP